MSEKVLTKEIAEQFLADPDGVGLDEFTSIEDEAAESLSNYQGDLHFQYFENLSDIAAESLSKHQGKINFINSKDWIEQNRSIAKSLSNGGNLDLTGFNLHELGDGLAKMLSKHRGDLTYNLDFEASDIAFKYLSKIQGKLYFGNITDINETKAKYLSKHCGEGLYISTYGDNDHYDWSNLFQPTNQVLEYLSTYKGELGLGMVALTSPTQAKIILNHSGGLVLNEDIILSKESMNVLKNYSCEINNMSAEKFVISDKIKSSLLDVKTMEEFLHWGVGECWEYQIPIYLYTEITDDAATLLSKQDEANIINASSEEGPIWLAENIVISNKAKKILSKWDGDINNLAAKEWVESLKD